MASANFAWSDLVRLVRAEKVEPQDRHGNTRFMYWESSHKASFISDPQLINDIKRARNHVNSFVLIGPQYSGKNIFLNLVARGNEGERPVACVDENVTDEHAADAELERFFGPEGVFDRNRTGLVHVDFMELATGWPSFIEKMHKIAVEKVLERTDRKIIACPTLRVVLGANYDLKPTLPAKPSLMRYLYASLSSNQLAETRRLEDQPERLPNIINEMIAVLVLRGEVTEAQAKVAAKIPPVALAQLREYSVPSGFNGLFGTVRDAVNTGNWLAALAKTNLGTVFVVWGGESTKDAEILTSRLREGGLIVKKAPEVLNPGDWWSQIKGHISKADFIVFTFSKSDFSPKSRLIKFKEWREAVEVEKSMNRPLIFPVCLDDMKPEQLRDQVSLDQALVDDFLRRHWYWVHARTGKGMQTLHEKLKHWFQIIRGS